MDIDVTSESTSQGSLAEPDIGESVSLPRLWHGHYLYIHIHNRIQIIEVGNDNYAGTEKYENTLPIDLSECLLELVLKMRNQLFTAASSLQLYQRNYTIWTSLPMSKFLFPLQKHVDVFNNSYLWKAVSFLKLLLAASTAWDWVLPLS